MESTLTPDFLRGAKRVTEKPAQKSFLKGAKVVEPSKKQFPLEDEDELQKDIERQQARLTSRGIETVLGTPGNILSFASSLFGKDQSALPTSQQLQEVSEKASGGYTSPRGKVEEFSDELFSDIAAMALPGAGQYNLMRNIGIPVVANLVKEGLKYKGGDASTQTYSKLGMMIALDLLSHNKGGAKKFSLDLFKQAENAIPESAMVNTQKIKPALDKLEYDLTAGGKRKTTTDALEKVRELKKEIEDGYIPAKRLLQYRPSINEKIEELGGFSMEMPKRQRAAAVRNLGKVKNEVISALEDYGHSANPEFLQLHRAANESYAAYEHSNKISNFIEKHATKTGQKTKLLLGLGGTGASYMAPGLAIQGAVAAAPVALGYQGFKLLNRVTNSPVLRKYYLGVLKGAAAGDSAAVAKNMKALDVNLEKSD